jgi:hypothetical protein
LAALEKALETLTRRHDMLRARFDLIDDQPQQIIEPEVPLHLPIEDLSALPADERDAVLGQALNEEVQQPFDLAGGVSVRYKLFKLDEANHILCVTLHHIITDAWSLGVYVSELNTLYKAYRNGQQGDPLAPLQVEYSDYAKWQRANLHGLRLSKLVNYWTDRLSGAPHVLQLPTDHPRPLDQTFNGTVSGFVFTDELSAAVIALSREYKVTTYMMLLACFYTLLYRYTGQEDIVVGTPVANRSHPELEPIIGIFVNTLILRCRLNDTQTFADLLGDIQKMTLDAFEHQALPFEKLIEEVNVERVPGYPPLYQVVFNFQNASLIESANPRAEGEVMEKGDFPFVHSNTSKVDLNLTLTQSGSKFSGGIEYNTDLFESVTIDNMIAHFKMIVEKVVEDAAILLMDIPLTVDDETNDEGQRPDDIGPADHARFMDFIEGGEFSFDAE